MLFLAHPGLSYPLMTDPGKTLLTLYVQILIHLSWQGAGTETLSSSCPAKLHTSFYLSSLFYVSDLDRDHIVDDRIRWIEGSIDDFDDILKASRRSHGIARFIVLPMKPSLISPRAPRCLCNLQTILLGANIFLCQGKGKRNRQVLHPPGDKLFQRYFTTDFVCKFVTFIKTFINQPQ